MQYDAHTAIFLAREFFLRGVDRKDAVEMLDSFSYHKYPKSRPARVEFFERGVRSYDRHLECEPDDFGRLKGKGYKTA